MTLSYETFDKIYNAIVSIGFAQISVLHLYPVYINATKFGCTIFFLKTIKGITPNSRN